MIFKRLLSSLSNLAPPKGATRQQTRVGRGPGSGRGKTSGRGTKGQKARQGVHPWFEGGQTPITKIFPKTGFKSKLPEPLPVNLGRIQELIDQNRLDPSKPITMRELYNTKSFNNIEQGMKILAGGAEKLKQPINLTATKATKYAIEKIESLGGSFKAEYYTELGMKALVKPDLFLAKYGRIPLRARPVDRRNIEYYRNVDNRGYLVDAPNAPKIKERFQKRNTTVSPLVETLRQLEN